jgi:hypothetical protein
MPTDLLYPDDIDARLNWQPGRASRLARRGKLPHYVLPDDAIRLRWDEIAPLVRHIPVALPAGAKGVRHGG